jgi:mannose-6-phosphate isomerase-like protein (cupin superfamily)
LAVLVTVGGLGMRAQQAPAGNTAAPGAPAAAPAPQGAAPAGAAAGQGGRQGGGGGGQANAPLQPNERAGVNIDRYIGTPVTSPAHLSHGGLMTHSILRAGDPNTPGAPAAVLEYRKELATAMLAPRNRTPLTTQTDQFLFYVTSGTGTLDDGKQQWDLREGVTALIPPGVNRRFTTTSNEPLMMVMAQWVPAVTPRADILVRDVSMIPYCEENAHWNNMSKCIFGMADGLMRNERFYLVLLPPFAMSDPHTHGPGTEEVWTKISPGTSIMLLGSELREMPQYSAYLVPPTGITQHANINLDKSKTEMWLYMARGAAPAGTTPPAAPAPTAPAAGRGGAGGGRGGGGNPNLTLGAAGSEMGTVAGRPLGR